MSGGRSLPKPRHTHATTPVSRKHQFSSAKLHVSMFLDDIASSHAIPVKLTGVFTALLDIPIVTPAGEIHFWVSVPLELHAVARPPVTNSLYKSLADFTSCIVVFIKLAISGTNFPNFMTKILFIRSSNWDNGRKAPDAWWPPSVMGVLQGSHSICPTQPIENHPYPGRGGGILPTVWKSLFVPWVFQWVAEGGNRRLLHLSDARLLEKIVGVTVLALWGNRHVTDGCCVRGSLSKSYWMQLPPTMYGVDIGLVESDFAPLVTCHLWGCVRFPALPCWWTTGVPSIVWRALPGRLLN